VSRVVAPGSQAPDSATGQAVGAPAQTSHLILNDELPIFPGSGGVEYLTTRHLPEFHEAVALVSMAHRRTDLERARGLPQAGVRLYLWESPFLDGVPASTRPRWTRRLHGCLQRAVTWLRAGAHRPADTLVAFGAFRNMAGPLTDALRERSWDVVSIIQSHAAPFLSCIPRPRLAVLVMHDVRALIYARRAAVADTWRERRRYRREARRYDAFERRYCAAFDLVVTVSDDDAAYVRTHYGPAHVVTRRLPIDATYWHPSASADRTGSDLLVFTGLMNHPPNVDAAIHMARDVMPLIRARRPTARLRIVGRHPTPEVQALVELPGVEVTGEVADVRPHLEEATAVVVPLRFGSGSRQKILEAWAMRKCVISTTVGAEGLDGMDGVHLVVADAAADFAKAALRALGDDSWREGLSTSGRAIVVDRHDPHTITRAYARDLARVGAARAAAMSAAPMRVAIDMRWMLPGVAGGIEQVARAFMRELLAIDRVNHYRLIVPAQIAHGFDLRQHPHVRTISLDGWSAYAGRAGQFVRGHLFRRLHLDDWRSPAVRALQWLHDLDAELVYAFPGYTHPDVQALPQVLMVPDIQHEYCPEFFEPAVLDERIRLYRDSIARATHLCAISEFTRQTLIERLDVAPDRVTTIPLAADAAFTATASADDGRVLAAHGLEAGQYFLFPGHTWKHKNHVAAIEALAVARDRYGIRLPLVCTGGAREAQPEIDAAIDRQGLRGAVRFLGYLPRGTLPVLYRHATSLVFTSIFEGFGMPVLEAMASGCPVVCSGTTSLPEIGGSAAVYVDPRDRDAIARALSDVASDRELRQRLRADGLAQAARFSWRRHTLDTVRVLYETRQQQFSPLLAGARDFQ
jgi:glycosyltransferase involved in cell wall biosynthesis